MNEPSSLDTPEMFEIETSTWPHPQIEPQSQMGSHHHEPPLSTILPTSLNEECTSNKANPEETNNFNTLSIDALPKQQFFPK
ncbi:hypothetical protein OIDMADRAFT_20555 [Oidiodendron maius Zn]|uniref:Uncharacterized protein n=1 Tax=Oidiodendron maius (strain Zn) TaxID=913774 RepID=A0A0C3GMR0_OIDMZ|nr:hypothetical protein OIDMADRAFT_20555 [Oidiodendron maius Zn]